MVCGFSKKEVISKVNLTSDGMLSEEFKIEAFQERLESCRDSCTFSLPRRRSQTKYVGRWNMEFMVPRNQDEGFQIVN